MSGEFVKLEEGTSQAVGRTGSPPPARPSTVRPGPRPPSPCAWCATGGQTRPRRTSRPRSVPTGKPWGRLIRGRRQGNRARQGSEEKGWVMTNEFYSPDRVLIFPFEQLLQSLWEMDGGSSGQRLQRWHDILAERAASNGNCSFRSHEIITIFHCFCRHAYNFFVLSIHIKLLG